jgi:hypothetical protein
VLISLQFFVAPDFRVGGNPVVDRIVPDTFLEPWLLTIVPEA